MWKLSRYWNRIAYFVIWIGRIMIWDQSGSNKDLLTADDFARDLTKQIMCDYR